MSINPNHPPSPKSPDINPPKPILAEILPPTDSNIQICADLIHQGGVVGMPTETVYGLAASAFNVKACEKIFEYKGRPLSDPLIVHVCSLEMALNITKFTDDNEKELFKLLSNKFWPGPLTIILNANLDLIDKKILANGTTVGIRFPINKVAQKFIKFCNVPIAAPSANKFCHISPVNPYHVFEDFKEFPIKILNDGNCNFCMESTVLKMDYPNKKVILFRNGACSPYDIKKTLESNALFKDFKVECLAKKNKKIIEDKMSEILKQKVDESFTINQMAPGQFLKHYSPKIETFLYSGDDVENYSKEIKVNSKIIFVDYMKILYKKFRNVECEEGLKEQNFLELSESGNPSEVMKNFYDYLHRAELMEDMKYIVICDLDVFMEENEHKLTLVDRMCKAAGFKRIKILYS